MLLFYDDKKWFAIPIVQSFKISKKDYLRINILGNSLAKAHYMKYQAITRAH